MPAPADWQAVTEAVQPAGQSASCSEGVGQDASAVGGPQNAGVGPGVPLGHLHMALLPRPLKCPGLPPSIMRVLRSCHLVAQRPHKKLPPAQRADLRHNNSAGQSTTRLAYLPGSCRVRHTVPSLPD